MNQQEHYDEAERLQAEGKKVLKKISSLHELRKVPDITDGTYDFLTAGMDEYGKKAHGIWLQVIGHALLANNQFRQDDDPMVPAPDRSYR